MVALPHSSNDSLEDTVKAVQDQQCRQEQQLERQRQSIAELKSQLEAALEEFQGVRPHSRVDVVPDANDTVKGEESLFIENNDIPEYQLEQSMWDALLLIFFQNTSGPDKVVLVIGFILNLGLQALLLLVLWLDMVDTNAYGQTKVQEMLSWRVSTGHSDRTFDGVLGQPLIQKLCAKKTWSFEQDQYSEMHDYLYKTIPGATLSVLALILWILSSMVEYRRIVEQGLAIIRLPTIYGNGLFHVKEAEEELEVVGARPFVRISIVLGLLVPRLVVLGFLCIGGCKYLAETASLHDLVLNAMALAFILDVDELLCQVLLPHRLRTKLDRVKPLPCGRRGSRVLGFSVNDWLRYLLTLGLVFMAIFVYLEPFMQNVKGAATALCGGKEDFSYYGGNGASPTVTLMNSSDYIHSCSLSDKEAHMSGFYGISANRTLHATVTSTAQADWARVKKEVVLAYAFKGCGPGLLMDASGNCAAVPSSLASLLPASVKPGANADPATCPVLQADNGASACAPAKAPRSCQWSWKDYRCEGDHMWPGGTYEKACSQNLGQTCQTWRYELRRAHPTDNCDIVDVCTSKDCASAYGTLDLQIQNTATFYMNQSLAWESLRTSLLYAINITEMTDGQVELQFNIANPDDTSSHQAGHWIVRPMPKTFFPSITPALNRTVLELANEKIAAVMGTNQTLATVLIGAGTYFMSQDYRTLMERLEGSGPPLPAAAPPPERQ